MTGYSTRRTAAVLFDRDGTLVADVPHNRDPERVVAMPTADRALGLLRAAGIPTGVITNQSGIALGLVTQAEVAAVNSRIDRLLGPFAVWEVCPHGALDGCRCRKPRPGMILRAAERLGIAPTELAVIGDIGSDVVAARAAGARGILVPTPVTRPAEIRDADEVATTLHAAVTLLLADAAATESPVEARAR
jgi:HAD superfamily hydrolase (TIGR01662 family)